MKIEMINDYQIRCTLTSEDLAKREIKISELKYGKAKTKQLFKEIIQEASLKYGFNQENYAVIVDAVPMKSNCIVLIITKVEDPKEIDTRFSRFAPSVIDEDADSEDFSSSSTPAEIMDLFNKIREEAEAIVGGDVSISISTFDGSSGEVAVTAAPHSGGTGKDRVFTFGSMYELVKPAAVLKDTYNGLNSLYKDKDTGRYLLVISEDSEHTESFSKACNILSEYGKLERNSNASESYFNEHFELVFEHDALQKIGKVMC